MAIIARFKGIVFFRYGGTSNLMQERITYIHWTPVMRDTLRKAYDAAISADNEEFTIKEGKFLTSYAKYLLEYLDEKLGV